MYGPRLLPMTGCELGLLGLFLGASVGSWIIATVSLLLIGGILLSLYRLRRGERSIK